MLEISENFETKISLIYFSRHSIVSDSIPKFANYGNTIHLVFDDEISMWLVPVKTNITDDEAKNMNPVKVILGMLKKSSMKII